MDCIHTDKRCQLLSWSMHNRPGMGVTLLTFALLQFEDFRLLFDLVQVPVLTLTTWVGTAARMYSHRAN